MYASYVNVSINYTTLVPHTVIKLPSKRTKIITIDLVEFSRIHSINVPIDFWHFWIQYFSDSAVAQSQVRQSNKYEIYNQLLHLIEDRLKAEMALESTHFVDMTRRR